MKTPFYQGILYFSNFKVDLLAILSFSYVKSLYIKFHYPLQLSNSYVKRIVFQNMSIENKSFCYILDKKHTVKFHNDFIFSSLSNKNKYSSISISNK